METDEKKEKLSMKYIVFGNINSDTHAVLHNIPYKIEYIVTNHTGCEQFEGKHVFTSAKIFQENPDNMYIFIADMENYPELSQQLVKMGLIEGKHFSGAIEYLYNQWESHEYFDDRFTVRVYHMSKFISNDSATVMDLGCGTQQLKRFISDSKQYIGVDYIKREKDTLTADFNKMQFPSQQADTIFCSGCLEYVENADWFIERMCEYGNKEIIISYCCLEYCMDIQQRRKCGWKNHMTIRQIIGKFVQYGFVLEYAEKSVGLNLIFKFVKSKGGDCPKTMN